MANYCVLSLSLCFLLSFHGCFAQIGQQQQQERQHRLRQKSECRIESLSALEPSRRIEAEAGITEIWDENNKQFDCAGVAAIRHVIQPNGLLLPSFANAPKLIYIVQGRGIQGTMIPGCPETYESGTQSIGDRGRRTTTDRHQKIRQFREGDVIALPAGVAHWAYNNGENPLICISILDTSNDANQLDQSLRKFFLAGNPKQEQQIRGQSQKGQPESAGNIFSGFDVQILADAFGVDPETARKLQSENDQRGNIIRVQDGLHVTSPQSQEEEEREQQHGRPNGLEETLCTLSLIKNIGDPSRADVYNPRGGLISSINSQKLPILNYIQLSAERGVLYRNAMMAPHWNMNAHSVIYVTRGNGRIQIVGNAGKCVFDGQIEEGQMLIVPQNYAVVKQAGKQGLEWVAIKTNDNAMTSPLAGRLSAIRGIPEEVLMNSYDISREDARNLKYNREELTVFSPGSRSQGRSDA